MLVAAHFTEPYTLNPVSGIASRIVGSVFTKNHNLTELLSNTFQQHATLTQQQRAAIQDLSYGTLRFYGTLNAVLQQLVHKPIADQSIRYLLLVSLYQLVFTDGKPYAIVDSAVTNAGALGKHYAKGFTNAILRNFLRHKEALLTQARQTDVGRYSHPKWWIKRMQDTYPNDWQALLLANNQHPPLTLRVNRRRTTAAAYLNLLHDVGLDAQLLDVYTLQLTAPVSVHKLPHFFDGYVSVQDWGAQFAAALLDLKDGMHVLDACAAPGGKTGHLLEMADISLTALDKDAQRLVRVEENLQRLQLHATVRCADASDPASWWDGQKFDRILADVPCSASGVVRRHPDIKWRRRPEDFAQFAAQQQKMLHQLWDCLRPKGKLLYTTCSVFPEENSAQIHAFVTQHSDAIQLNVSLNHNGQLLPNQQHDGFYYALFQKA